MEQGKNIEIVSVSRGQQYDIYRPVNIGDKGVIDRIKYGNVWYLTLIDPKDGRHCTMWFHEFDFKIIE